MKLYQFHPKDNSIDALDLQTVCAPWFFEDEMDSIIEYLQEFSIEASDVKYVPSEAFSIISLEREPQGVFGYILFNNTKPMWANNKDKNIKYHQITFIGIDERLHNYDWIKDALHTIFHKIIKCDTKQEKDKKDIVWLTYNGIPYSKTMCKEYDIDNNMFAAEAAYFANIICPQTEKK